MSAEAVAHVYRCSEFKGSMFSVLLAIADSVNDQHNNEVWMHVSTLSAKSRVSGSSVSAALTGLVDAGWLLQLSDSSGGRRRATRYRFIHDESRRVVYETRSNKPSKPWTVSETIQNLDETIQISDETIQNLDTHKEEPKRTQRTQTRTRPGSPVQHMRPVYPTAEATAEMLATARSERADEATAREHLKAAKQAIR